MMQSRYMLKFRLNIVQLVYLYKWSGFVMRILSISDAYNYYRYPHYPTLLFSSCSFRYPCYQTELGDGIGGETPVWAERG